MKDDLLLSTPPPLFPNIFGDSAISDFPCVNPSTDVSTTDHLHNTLDVGPSFDTGEEKLFIENPLHFSSAFFGNTEGEHSFFSYTVLFDLVDREDAIEIIDFSDRSCRDPFTPVFEHDDDYIAIDLFKPPLYDDLFVNEVETPQTIEAL